MLKHKKFLSLFILILFSVLSLPQITTIANAESLRIVHPTYLADFGESGNNLISLVTLSSNLDDKAAVLISEFTLESETKQTLKCCVPVYGNYCDLEKDKVTFAIDGVETEPSFTFAFDTIGIYTELSYNDVIKNESASSKGLDMATMCYSYEFASNGKGTVEFTVKDDAVVLKMFSSFSSDSTRRYKLNTRTEKQRLVILRSDLEILESKNTVIVRKELTLAELYAEAVENNLQLVDEMGGQLSANAVRRLVDSRLVEAVNKKIYNLEDLVFAVNNNGFAFYNFTFDVPIGKTCVTVRQPFYSSLDYCVEPIVQNYYIMTGLNVKAKFSMATERFILPTETVTFTKSGSMVEYEGKLSERVALNVCESENIRYNNTREKFSVGLVVTISVCITVVAACFTLLVIGIIKTKKEL